ncbi:MAG: hypothetical protein M1820_004441 [Bogoriella megaspora]|nr:MAG: hypothetical protein M1820_004441 [Bogoriella megaspora]
MSSLDVQPSDFLSLPRELRDEIYSYLTTFSKSQKSGSGLLLTCRQVRDEFLQECCRSAKFNIGYYEFDLYKAFIALLSSTSYQHPTPKILLEINAVDARALAVDIRYYLSSLLVEILRTILNTNSGTQARITFLSTQDVDFLGVATGTREYTAGQLARQGISGIAIVPKNTAHGDGVDLRISRLEEQETIVDDDWVYVTTVNPFITTHQVCPQVSKDNDSL